EQAISEIRRKGAPTQLSLQSLDSFAARVPEEASTLRDLLIYIGAKIASRRFGWESVLWCASTYEKKLGALSCLTEALQDRGVDLDSFTRSRRTARSVSRDGPISARLVTEVYTLLMLHEAACGLVNLPNVLCHYDNYRRGFPRLSDRAVGEYQLKPIVPDFLNHEGLNSGWRHEGVPYKGNIKRHRIRLDGPIGLQLSFRGTPQAVCTLLPVAPSCAMIVQMQGIPGRIYQDENAYNPLPKSDAKPIGARGLIRFKTPHLLTRIGIEFARIIGLTEIAIQSGSNNRWTNFSNADTRFRLDPEKAHQIYDKTAHDFGFTQRADGNWWKSI
ncbi:MAG: hypothetical protein KDD42_07010, partial [Bdellovibrionales bacterium]|nr:hypothetical protein [Bdellovibrionales bacterium]